MVKPSIDELTHGRFNRYILVIATAKSARYITNVVGNMKNSGNELLDTPIVSHIEAEEEKPVKIAINKLKCGDIKLEEETLETALHAGLNGAEGIG